MIKLISEANKYQKEYQALSTDTLSPGTPTGTEGAWKFTYPTETGTRTDIIGNGASCLMVDTSEVYDFHDGEWYSL